MKLNWYSQSGFWAWGVKSKSSSVGKYGNLYFLKQHNELFMSHSWNNMCLPPCPMIIQHLSPVINKYSGMDFAEV